MADKSKEKKIYETPLGKFDLDYLIRKYIYNQPGYSDQLFVSFENADNSKEKNKGDTSANMTREDLHKAYQNVVDAQNLGLIKWNGNGSFDIDEMPDENIDWNDLAHQLALRLWQKVIMSSNPMTDTPLQPYTSGLSIASSLDNLHPGYTLQTSWYGGADLVKARRYLAEAVGKVIEDVQANEYDYKNSAYKNKDEYITALSNFLTRLKDLNVPIEELHDEYVNLRGDGNKFNELFGYKAPETDQETLAQKNERELRESLVAVGRSEEWIDKYINDRKEYERAIADLPNRKYDYNVAFNDFVKNNWYREGRKQEITVSLGNDKFKTGEMENWNKFFTNSDYDKKMIPQSFEHVSNLVNTLTNLPDLLFKIIGSMDTNDKHALRAYLYSSINNPKTSSYYTRGNGDWYYINNTINLNSGTGLAYNTKTKQIRLIPVDKNTTPILWKKLTEQYKKQNPEPKVDMFEYGVLTERHGGKLLQLKYLRNGGIVKDLAGAALTLEGLSNALIEQELNHRVSLERKTVLNLKEKLLSKGLSEELIKNKMQKGISTSDYVRLGSAAADLIGAGASFAGPYGVAGSAIEGVGADVARGVADYMDGASAGEAIWNTAKGLGMTAATSLPFFALGKLAKTFKTIGAVLKTSPYLLAGYNIVTEYDDAKQSFENINKGNGTAADWENISNFGVALANALRTGGFHASSSKMRKVVNKPETKTYIKTKEGKVEIKPEDLLSLKLVSNTADLLTKFKELGYEGDLDLSYTPFIGLRSKNNSGIWGNLTSKSASVNLKTKYTIPNMPEGAIPDKRTLVMINYTNGEDPVLQTIGHPERIITKPIGYIWNKVGTPKWISRLGEKHDNLYKPRYEVRLLPASVLTQSSSGPLTPSTQLVTAPNIELQVTTPAPKPVPKLKTDNLRLRNKKKKKKHMNGGTLEYLKMLRQGGEVNFTLPVDIVKALTGVVLNLNDGKDSVDDIDDLTWDDIRYMNYLDDNKQLLRRERKSDEYGKNIQAPDNDQYDEVPGGPEAEADTDNQWFYNRLKTDKAIAEKWARAYVAGHNNETSHGKIWFKPDNTFDFEAFLADNKYGKNGNKYIWEDQINGEGHDVYRGKVAFIRDANGKKKYFKYGEYDGYTLSTEKDSLQSNGLIDEYELVKKLKNPTDDLTQVDDLQKKLQLVRLTELLNPNQNNNTKNNPYINQYKWNEYLANANELGRLIYGLYTNNRIASIGKTKLPALKSPYIGNRNIYGDFAALQAYNNLAAKIESKANLNAEQTSNAELGNALRLEALLKANDILELGRQIDNKLILSDIKDLQMLRDKIYQLNHDVKDENMARITAKINADKDVEMGRLNSNYTNLNNYLMGIELRLRDRYTDWNQRASKLYYLRMQQWAKNAIDNDPEYLRLLKAFNDNPNDITARNRFLTYSAARMKQLLPIILQLYRNLYSGQFNGLHDFDWLAPTADMYTVSEPPVAIQTQKRGGRIIVDSSRMKYRADDLRELRKLIRTNIRASLHALDNVSKATLLELKKMMGI